MGWYRVKVTPNSLVVNGGELLNEMSGGLFKATIHRVLDIGEPRYSMPFFYEPCCDANIYERFPCPLLPKGYVNIHENDYLPYASFVLNKMSICAEYRMLAESMPDWVKEKLQSETMLGCG